jgi:hypothetical protein
MIFLDVTSLFHGLGQLLAMPCKGLNGPGKIAQHGSEASMKIFKYTNSTLNY